jgi:hypothetical protein
MMQVLEWIENTSFSVWVRESPNILAFPTVLLIHTIGMALCVGINAGINLRILGLAPGLKLSPLERFLPILWFGFTINALINLSMLRKRVFRSPAVDSGPLPANVRVLAVTSLFFWLGAITCGRLLAYVGPIGGGLG